MDVRLIIQVLVNLIDNAIKYTPPGTVISIRGTKTDGKAQISVEDNGPGIPEEMKPHIFQMFYTAKQQLRIVTEVWDCNGRLVTYYRPMTEL